MNILGHEISLEDFKVLSHEEFHRFWELIGVMADASIKRNIPQCQLEKMDGHCCCNCKFHRRAAISTKIGDLGLAEMKPDRWACLNPEGDCIVLFHYLEQEHGLCEMWEGFKELSETP